MARIRTIKPSFWDDQKIATVPRDARLTFIGLWNYSDDFGVVSAHPHWIKTRIFPYDDIKPSAFLEWLEALEGVGAIVKFNSNGESWYYIRNFTKHQRIDKPNKKFINAEIPAEVLNFQLPIPIKIKEDSTTNPRPIPSGMECNVVEGKKKAAPDYPEWLDKPLWAEFKKYRTAIKSPLTKHAELLCLDDLKKIMDEGYNQVEIINHTLKSGKWKSFYAPRNGVGINQNGGSTMPPDHYAKIMKSSQEREKYIKGEL